MRTALAVAACALLFAVALADGDKYEPEDCKEDVLMYKKAFILSKSPYYQCFKLTLADHTKVGIVCISLKHDYYFKVGFTFKYGWKGLKTKVGVYSDGHDDYEFVVGDKHEYPVYVARYKIPLSALPGECCNELVFFNFYIKVIKYKYVYKKHYFKKYSVKLAQQDVAAADAELSAEPESQAATVDDAVDREVLDEVSSEHDEKEWVDKWVYKGKKDHYKNGYWYDKYGSYKIYKKKIVVIAEAYPYDYDECKGKTCHVHLKCKYLLK